MGDLCGPCRKLGQDHHRVIIYVLIVGLLCYMPRFVEIDPPVPESVFTIYGQGSHIGHVTTCIIYVHIGSPFLSNLALIGHAVSEKSFAYYGNIHVNWPRIGADQSPGVHFFSES